MKSTNSSRTTDTARSRRQRWLLACALLAGSLPNWGSEVAARFGPDVDALVAASYPGIEALYRDLHAHPELALEEVYTSHKLALAMRDLGFEVTEGIAKTGLVAMLRNGAGPTIMVRTELDALPMEEKTGLPYASKVRTTFSGRETFVAHSCGHDLHMAAWVGTAKTLVALKERWHGTLPSRCTRGRWPTGKSGSIPGQCCRAAIHSRPNSTGVAPTGPRPTSRSPRS
jgi:hippurate hydrolase